MDGRTDWQTRYWVQGLRLKKGRIALDFKLIISQSLEDTQVGYILQKYTLDKYTFDKLGSGLVGRVHFFASPNFKFFHNLQSRLRKQNLP